MKKGVVGNNKFVLLGLILILGIVMVSVFVLAVSFIATVTPATTNESIVTVYNFTIDNTNTTANITSVNITLPTGFSFNASTNGTTATATFSNATSSLIWTNSTLLELINASSIQYFWFNATASTPGTYNFTVNVTDSSGVSNSTNVSITVNDTTAPIITSPANATLEYKTDSLSVDFNATDDSPINWTVNDTTNFIINSITGVLTNNTVLAIGNYSLLVSVNDTSNNTNTTTYLVTVQDTTAPVISAPASATLEFTTEALSEDFNATDDSALDTWSVNDTTNFTIDSTTGVLTNNTVLAIGNYSLLVSVNDTSNNTNTTTYLVTVQDTTAPNVSIISPRNTTYHTKKIKLNYISSDLNLNTTWYNYNGKNVTLSGNITFTAVEGTSTLTLYANDSVGNVNSTSIVFKVNTTVISSSSGTVTSTGGYPNYQPSQSELKNGYNRELYRNWKISFEVENESHLFKVQDINSSTATVILSSTPQEATLSVGEEKEFDLNGDGYYDVLVKLNSIDSTSKVYPKASFTMQSIHKEITTTTQGSNGNNTTTNNNENKQASTPTPTTPTKTNLTWLWILIAVVIVVLGGFGGYKKFRK